MTDTPVPSSDDSPAALPGPPPDDATATSHIRLAAALAALPGPNGERFALAFRHGTLEVEVYAPRGVDPQQPHTRDEAYLVARGSGEFVCDGAPRACFTTGDFLFARAGVAHRFERFTDDLVLWVLFYGPAGGEAP